MMERREPYDPEDIEQLMRERGFDELLAEERAFVLRHLEDRAAYERMRALLQHLSADTHAGGTDDADPVVKEQLLATFRSERRPGYTVWLNSVAAFLMPRQPAERWRMALALGTVALLISVALLSPWMARDAAVGPLAQVPADRTSPAAKVGATQQDIPAVVDAAAAQAPASTTADEPQDMRAGAIKGMTATTVITDDLEKKAAIEAPALEAQLAEDRSDDHDGMVAGGMDLASGSTAPEEDQVAKHVVQAAELVTNQSMAQQEVLGGIKLEAATSSAGNGRDRKAERARKDRSKEAAAASAVDPSPYLGLLRAAW